MRSGNGRHRRPRQAPAIFVAAGVTGAGLAMPLLAAGGAQAADGATWDRVAECESGGLWSANAGNGYYGGLQLTLETWKEYGGTALAARPDLASRSQQIEIGEKILAEEGPEAWPSCSISAGLLPDAPDAPDVEVPDVPEVPDTGLPDAELPDAPDAPDVQVPDAPELPDAPDGSTESPADGGSSDAGSSDDGSADGGSTDGSTEQDEDATPAPDATPSPDGTSGTGAGIGEPAPETTAEPSAPTGAPDGEGSDGTGRHRGSADDRPRDTADRPSRGKHGKSGDSADADSYRVRPGDSLSAIAAEHDVPGGWSALYEANEKAIGDDPDLILPGQLLDLRTGGELR